MTKWVTLSTRIRLCAYALAWVLMSTVSNPLANGLLPHPLGGGPKFHPRRLLVKPKLPVHVGGATAQLAPVHIGQGVRVIRKFHGIGGLELVELPAGTNVPEMMETYRRTGLVEYAEPDYEVKLAATPNDPGFLEGFLWPLHNTGQQGGLADADIDALEGWQLRSEAPSVIVAVIDTGIRYTHEDLKANLWMNPNEIPGNHIDDDGNGFIDDVYGINAITQSGDPTDDHGHGTHVAGIIGAVGNNGRGVVGVVWRLKLMACKFLSAEGSGYYSDAITCIDYARRHGATVMNNSWGGGGYSQALEEAIQTAAGAGIIFVASAGNTSSDNDAFAFYPGSFTAENVVTVMATTRWDDLASFSNFGHGSVAMGAPGLDITSTWNASDAAYAGLSGTSMAAPVVSGVFALMRAQFPGETYFQLFNRVYGAVDPLTGLTGKCSTGGRVNLLRALSSTSSRPGNDEFAGRLRLTLSNFSTRGINVDATREPGEPAHPTDSGGKSVWWSWQPPSAGVATIDTAGTTFQPLLAIYKGATLADLQFKAGNQPMPPAGATEGVWFDAEAGAEYAIAVDGFEGASGKIVLNVAFSPRPVNDQFGDRLVISGSLASVTGSNTLATIEAGEPSHASPESGGKSVWWSWTPVSTEAAMVTTAGSDFDTLLAVYTGTELSQLSLVARNDDDPSGQAGTSRVDFNAIAGTTYQIAVDGSGGADGNITLNTPPLNDHFGHRIELSGASSRATGFNVLATKEPLEPNILDRSGGRSVWWTWTAPLSGRFSITTVGSTFDTLLGVYTGSTLDSVSLVALNDNDPYGNRTSLVSFDAAAGATYAIVVDGPDSASGEIRLTVSNTDYAITELAPAAGYGGSAANAMNSVGDVAGYCIGFSPETRFKYQACIWRGGATPEFICTDATESSANDINDLGQVVGYLIRPGGSQVAFLWQNGVVRELADSTGLYRSVALAIDEAGRAVGWFFTRAEEIHGFLWQDGVITDLGAIGTGRTIAVDLLGPDFIVGYAQTADGTTLGPPLVWRNLTLEAINTPSGATAAQAMSVNALSQVVGTFTDNVEQSHAFFWEDGLLTELGDGDAFDINNLSQVVGWDRGNTALVWRDGHRTNLLDFLPADSGWELWWGVGITDWGQIVGAGSLNGNNRGFVMTPLVPPPPRPILLSPTNHQGFQAYEDIVLTSWIVPSVSGVLRVEYFEGLTQIGTASSAPYAFTWRAVPGREYDLSARAITMAGGAEPSPIVHVVVAPPLIPDGDGDGLPDTWETSHGLDPADASDALIDTQGDGRPNLLKYALGIEPDSSAEAQNEVVTSTVFDGTGHHLCLQFKRRLNAPWLHYIPEVSADMRLWDSDSDHVQVTDVAFLDEEFELVTVQDSSAAMPGTPRFFRVRIFVN